MIKLPDTQAAPALEIMPAAHGGFVVTEVDFMRMGGVKTPLYAGDLSACMEFIRLTMKPLEAGAAAQLAPRVSKPI